MPAVAHLTGDRRSHAANESCPVSTFVTPRCCLKTSVKYHLLTSKVLYLVADLESGFCFAK